MSHTKLTLPERKLIATWRNEGRSMRECARLLGCAHTTVVREWWRNRYHGKAESFYEPLHAQAQADKRKRRAWEAKHPLKNSQVYTYVLENLRKGWSPEQISGRLRKVDHPGEADWQICPEAIYRFIYHPQRKAEQWWEYLRRKQKRRRHKLGRKAQRCRIPDRVSIHQRPAVIEGRREVGHWEGDTLVGQGRKHGLHTAYERVASFTRIELMTELTAAASLSAQRKIYTPLPEHTRRSTTLDNGHEHVLHTQLKLELGVVTYFADPYSAWQRGGNENNNLWIRYYFPKGTDFRTITEEDLRDVEEELNTRPRKRLGYKTPLEVFTSYLVQS